MNPSAHFPRYHTAVSVLSIIIWLFGFIKECGSKKIRANIKRVDFMGEGTLSVLQSEICKCYAEKRRDRGSCRIEQGGREELNKKIRHRRSWQIKETRIYVNVSGNG